MITGGAGYIGSVLAPYLLEKGYSVTVLDVFRFGQSSLLDCCANKHFDVVRGDCRDESLMKTLMKDKDIVIPLAALVGAPLCDQDKIGAESINFKAVDLICKLPSKSQRVLYPTTNSGDGIGDKGKFCT